MLLRAIIFAIFIFGMPVQARLLHGTAPPAVIIQAPGLSTALFNTPYYTCSTNWYVNASTGSNANDGTAPTVGGGHGPWATIAHAEVAALTGGHCVNVAAGTYSAGNSALSKGGTTAATTGYVTYRCSTPAFISGSGCIITGGNSFAAGNTFGGNFPSYLIFDGFNLANPALTGTFDDGVVCVGSVGGTNPTTSPGCHHWITTNNVISGHGQGGVGSQGTEYWIISHNVITQNAHQCTSGVYGSGIGIVVSAPVSGYTPTADDTNASNNSALNLLGLQGPSFSAGHTLAAYNVIYNNYQGCGPPSSSGFTDGNGIIVDTNEIGGITGCNTGGVVNYSGGIFIAFNVVYNNGGGGIHIFTSSFVTIANNSVYYNFLDPQQQPFVRSQGVDVSCGTSNGFGASSNVWFNNIAYSLAIPAGPTNATANAAINYGGHGTDIDAVFNAPYGHNITIAPTGNTNGSTPHANGIAPFQNPPNANWSCMDNKCNADPLWVAVGGTSTGGTTGDQIMQPSAVNFALQAGSPAIGYAIGNGTYSYMPPWVRDVGACDRSFSVCP